MFARTLQGRIRTLASQFPSVFLTGPRQSGKTTLARSTFPGFEYLSLEDLQTRQEALEDPRGFLHRLEGAEGVILDEVQRAPDLFSYLQGFLDERRAGPVILTGSQHFLLSDRISQSLAGRAALCELLPLSVAELARRRAQPADAFDTDPAERIDAPASPRDVLLWSGTFPRIHEAEIDARAWLDGYIRTYVERDVRTLANVGNLDAFTRFVGLCAGRTGQLLNLSSLGADAGVTHDTARRWVSILEASYVVALLRPHSQSFSKRLVKTPKLYFVDTGLLCALLGIRSSGDLRLHPLRGAVFECFVVSELRKRFLHQGERAPIWFWRDRSGHEVDVLVDLGARRVAVEVKSGETLASDAFRGLDYYAKLAGSPGGVVVYGGDASYQRGPYLVRAWFACS
jgi:uncharacterized protein